MEKGILKKKFVDLYNEETWVVEVEKTEEKRFHREAIVKIREPLDEFTLTTMNGQEVYFLLVPDPYGQCCYAYLDAIAYIVYDKEDKLLGVFRTKQEAIDRLNGVYAVWVDFESRKKIKEKGITVDNVKIEPIVLNHLYL